MHVRSTRFLSTLLFAALVACRTAAPASSSSIIRPGAPGDSSRVEAVTPAAAPKHTDADVKFDYAAGGIRCADCAAGAPGREIPARARNALQQMAAGATPALEHTAGHWWLLSRYLDHHVLEGSSLHSLTFLAAVRGGDPCAG